jgi:hypothetical protein
MKYIPERLLEVFCEFTGITDIRKSSRNDEAYRGFFRDSVVIFFRVRGDWLSPECTRITLAEEFLELTKTFLAILDETEENTGQNASPTEQ